MRPTVLILATGLVWLHCTEGLADDLKAEQKFTESNLHFDLRGSYNNVTLTVVGPNRFHASAFSKTGAPSIDLRRLGPLQDGLYVYELTASTDEKISVKSLLDNGRDARASAERLKGVETSGTFRVKGGVIIKQDGAARSGKRDQQ